MRTFPRSLTLLATFAVFSMSGHSPSELQLGQSAQAQGTEEAAGDEGGEESAEPETDDAPESSESDKEGEPSSQPAGADDAAEAGAADEPETDPQATDEATDGVADDPLESARIALELPPKWSSTVLHHDALGTVSVINGAGAPIEMYTVDLGAHGVDPTKLKAAKRKASQLAWNFVAIDKNMDLEPKGRTVLKIPGCQITTRTYRDGKHQVRVASCVNPTWTQLYVWRIDLRPATAPQHDAMEQNFNAFLSRAVEVQVRPPDTGDDDAQTNGDGDAADEGADDSADGAPR